MFTEQLAKIILVPYLWFGGYDMDSESIAECYDVIEIYCRSREQNQKRCLCGPECPYCSGSCSTCDCIYKPLPPPGPGKIKWVRIRIQALRSRF